jgi:putative SOS response-associated peptidase YedK
MSKINAMCYHTKLTAEKEDIEKEFEATYYEPESYIPKEAINGFAFAKNPIVMDEDKGHIVMANWGLIPFWAKDDSIKKMTLNSRIETAASKPAFRNSVKNRCLIIADAFYEWQWLDAKGKEKQKYIIKPTDQEIFGFAGFYSEWTNHLNGENITSYTIATTEANELMAEIHNNKKRMPIILKKENRNDWLKGETLENFQFPYEVDLIAKAI